MTDSALLEYKQKLNQISLRLGRPLQLFILTPCYGGMVFVNYCNRIIKTIELLNQCGVRSAVEMMSNESLITRARNNMIAKAMSFATMTHMLFIDADVTWEPIDVVKLLCAEKDVVGGIYPFKHYFLDWITPEFLQQVENRNQRAHNKEIDHRTFLEQNLLKYNLNYKPDSAAVIDRNLMEIQHLATGFMMLTRSCIEKMFKAYPETKHNSDGDYLVGDENQHCYALFDCFIKDNRYLSEDWAFCDRWIQIGGKVYADITIGLQHTGLCHHQGRILSTLDLH